MTQAAFLHEPRNVSEIPKLETISGETIYGTLASFPHTFTFFVTEETPFSALVSMDSAEEAHDVSFLLVKEEKRGVSEVGRLYGKEITWTKKYDVWRAVTFTQGEEFSATLEPGVYKLEVSSPNNDRGYRLVLGEGDSAVLKELSLTRRSFKVHPLSIFLSPFILIPLIFGLLYGTYRFRRSQQDTHD